MEMVESRLRMMKKSQEMTLEKYLYFIDSNKKFDLTTANLNEVSLSFSLNLRTVHVEVSINCFV